ncbi:unnamed protein product [Phyllotreta striolata]|uniref:Snurportin-1 n=1 Tax=Phyllotreta striolata TaxID=444603 RepID=A0A9N9XKI4_PHYSR|nr:unnamed protein product [Phyllotreta striolata]
MESTLDNSVSHPHAFLYKFKESKFSQNERRLKYLEEQKIRRQELTDKNRELCDLFIKEIEESREDEEMELDSTENRRTNRLYFKLMITEWFLDIPEDLEENWFVKLVPEGFRILLVARNQHTFIYNNKGRFLFRIKTNFPGGGNGKENGTTVLDCVCNKKINTVFILDCLFWNSMSTIDSEASFRFYWLANKFKENPELGQFWKYKFVLVEALPAERSLIQDKMFQTMTVESHSLLYEGITFYHKESQYTFGYTPLATWLASYMLPEKLGIDIPEIYLGKRPQNYVNLQHFVENESLFTKKRKRKTRTPGEQMEL